MTAATRVGILTTSYPKFEGDIAGAFVRDTALGYAEAGHGVDVIAPAPRVTPSAPPDRGVRVHWTPYTWPRALAGAFDGLGFAEGARTHPARAALGALFPAAAWHHHRRLATGWTQVESHWAFPLALLAARLAPHAERRAVFHGADVRLLERTPLAAALSSRVARSAHRLQFVSEDLLARFRALLPRDAWREFDGRAFVQPMPVRPPATLPSRDAARAQLGFTRPTILSMGRLVAVKRVDALVHAAPALHDAGFDVVIAGGGPEEASLRALAASLGVRIRFLGTLRGTDKWAALAGADVLVSLSEDRLAQRTEGTPVTVLEARALGLPVVTTDAGGLRDHADGAVLLDGVTPAEILRTIRLARTGPAHAQPSR